MLASNLNPTRTAGFQGMGDHPKEQGDRPEHEGQYRKRGHTNPGRRKNQPDLRPGETDWTFFLDFHRPRKIWNPLVWTKCRGRQETRRRPTAREYQTLTQQSDNRRWTQHRENRMDNSVGNEQQNGLRCVANRDAENRTD